MAADLSPLDKKYFVDTLVYNCAFCNRNNVPYHLEVEEVIDWSDSTQKYVLLVRCGSCSKRSLHLSHSHAGDGDWYRYLANQRKVVIRGDFDFDQEIFYSHPASKFVVDERIQPKIVRNLIMEAIGCLDMNYTTGASACARKAIYELLGALNAEGNSYEDKIKSLKGKNQYADPVVFDMLSHIQGATSDIVHEDSSSNWNASTVRFVIATLLSALTEIFIVPAERAARAAEMEKLYSGTKGKNSGSKAKPEGQP